MKNHQKRTTHKLNLSSSSETKPINCDYFRNIGITITFDGNPNGEFIIEASNDESTWQRLTFTEGQILAEGTPDSHIISLSQFNFGWLKIKYNQVSGSGNADITIQLKAT